ncbi:MAG: flagellar hook-length control protein FliK [Chromatiales bacterium]|nr:flagellar hook-length control protein FliK [Chromatiales bacterium]
MTAAAMNTNAISLLKGGSGLSGSGSFSRVVGQRIDSQDFSSVLQSAETMRSLGNRLQTLHPENFSEELAALPPEMLQQLQAAFDDGKILPQAAEITPMIEAATASMEEAVKALDNVTAELDQAMTVDDLLAFLTNAGLNGDLREQVRAAAGEVRSGLADGANQSDPAQVLKSILQQTTSGLNTKITTTIADGEEIANQAVITSEMLQRQLRDGVAATDRLNLIAEKMKAVGEATPQLAKEVSSLGQLLGPAMKVLSQSQSGQIGANANKVEGGSFDGLLSGLGGLSELGSRAADKLAPSPLTMAHTAKGWDQALGDRVMWMVGNNVQQASLKISPQNLGPIEIQLSMQDDVAKVNFVTHSGAVKEALEAAIPRLREMFSEQNLQLANVDVGQRGAQDQQGLAQGSAGGEGQQGENFLGGNALLGETDQEQDGAMAARVTSSGLGLVDDYA